MRKEIDFETIIPKFDHLLSRGLSKGLGSRDKQMCIEAAICAALDLPHSDDPDCVTPEIRSFKIQLNDADWSSPLARAKGLRDLGIAQVGSFGVVNGIEFAACLSKKTISVLIPQIIREIFPNDISCELAAKRCETEGTAAAMATEAAEAAAMATDAAAARAAAWAVARAAAIATDAAAKAAAKAAEAAAKAAARAAANAARAATEQDKYLILSAKLALEVLTELNSPGVKWINWKKGAKIC